MATSEHKQFASTHKDTFSRSHLTKQPTGNRTDTSLSALRSLFSEISRPRCYQAWVALPAFFCCLNYAQGILGKDAGAAPPPPPPPPLPPAHLFCRQQEVSAPTSSSARANAEVVLVEGAERSLSVLHLAVHVLSLLSSVNPVCCLP